MCKSMFPGNNFLLSLLFFVIGKCTVYVTCELRSGEHWISKKFVPQKDEILYKRVIHYEVPDCEQFSNMMNPGDATLHLECPQSNQYCTYPITYVPDLQAAGKT